MGLFGGKKDKGKVTQRFSDGGYEKIYKDGTTERVRFTKTREVHDFDGPRGKASISGVRESKGGIMGIFGLKKENERLKKENRRLHNLCKEKDSYFMELMSDGLRHGSKLAAKHMSDRKKYMNGK